MNDFLKSIGKFILFFVTIFVAIYIILNWPAVSINAKYYWNNLFHHQKMTEDAKPSNFLPEIKSVKQPTAKSLGYQNNRIIIKKLNLNVPIVWNSSQDKFVANLKYGVGHYQGTALPGQKGNVFIAGHSSSYWWERGPYSSIFAIIDKLNPDDEVIITYKNRVFLYRVTEKIVVKPDQVEVMKSSHKKTLTLMTCTPVGTALNRLIVRASQIAP